MPRTIAIMSRQDRQGISHGMRRAVKYSLLSLLLAGLAACSGGAKTESNADTTSTASTASVNYTGPAPESTDVQAFKNNFWVNVVSSSRCGGCHNETKEQSPTFARLDDVNVAYQQALQVVDLAQPDQSTIVTKVGGGHNCWTSSDSACADILTTWIRNWASASGNTGTGTQIELVAPVDKDVGSTKTFPDSSAIFASTVYPLLTEYCSGCHSPSATSPQKPYFASDDVDEAYSEAKAKINLDTPALSRLYVRLESESHNCWSDCASNAATMLAAIQSMVDQIPTSSVDSSLVLSKALTMYDGTIASGGNRYETNTIARYFFKEGTGTIANDTSGVDPAANLTLSGSVTWSGGWGAQITSGGKLQATTTTSQKFASLIKSTGEYTIEAWVAPANVAQEDANIVSYSGGDMSRNFTLGQHAYQYEGFNRSSVTDTNGEPSLLTDDDDKDAQASLQHVVMTYDPINGRKIYVNGIYTGDADSAGAGNLDTWDSTFALVMGNETGSTRPWAGLIKFVAIFDKALTLDQIQQNFAAGVGERYYLLFNVSSLTNVAQSYIMFEVSQYDSYSYLFNKPTFISLDDSVTPGSIEIKGIRIGINGTEAAVGQAYIPLDVTVSDANYNAETGQLLSSIGTVIPLEKGPDSDLFFLTFEKIGTHTRAYSDTTTALSLNSDTSEDTEPDVGFKLYEEIDATLSKITGVPRTNSTVQDVYETVKQQLPTAETIDSFLSSHQIGVAQLASAYCSALVESSTLRAAFFPSLSLSSNTLTSSTERNAVIDPLISNSINTGVSTQPTDAEVRAELNDLMDRLCTTSNPCTAGGTRTQLVIKASCTAALASGITTIQ